jgi:hypothetical protein
MADEEKPAETPEEEAVEEPAAVVDAAPAEEVQVTAAEVQVTPSKEPEKEVPLTWQEVKDSTIDLGRRVAESGLVPILDAGTDLFLTIRSRISNAFDAWEGKKGK